MPKLPNTKKITVAVIGAGTGLTAAWAADASEELDVWVFEEKPVAGGNIQSPVIHGIPREAGAEFIGPKGYCDDSEDADKAYRDTHRLFDVLGIQREELPLTMSFQNIASGQEITLPPIQPYYNEADQQCMGDVLSCLGLFKKTNTTTNARVVMSTLWDHFFDLIALKDIIDDAREVSLSLQAAKQKTLHANDVMTLEDLAEAFIMKGQFDFIKQQRRRFVDNILYPLIAAGWGLHHVQEARTFCAHYAMHYLEITGKWYHVPAGIHSYFDKLLTELSPRTKILTNCSIASATPVQVDGETKYLLSTADGEPVRDEQGQPVLFDDLIIATPAYATAKILAPVDDEDTQQLCKKLNKIEFFDTTIIHHQDPNCHFKNRTVVNTIYDPVNDQAYNTMTKYFADTVRKAWLLPGQPRPDNILHETQFRHAKITRSYYDSEQSIHRLQGKNGIFYGGTMAGWGDGHESGIRANLQVVAKCLKRHGLNPANNPRLQHFPESLASVKDWMPPQTSLSDSASEAKEPIQMSL